MKTHTTPQQSIENSNPHNETISLAGKITELDNAFKWELLKWICIIENQMDMLEDTKEPEVIGWKTQMITHQ